jgi:hypothetical protein
MDLITGCIDALPLLVKLSIAVLLWTLSCILALNLAFGKDSLFMYNQLEYMIGGKAAVVVFYLGWLLWPIGLPAVYISLAVIVMDKEHWIAIVKRCRKILLWIVCSVMAIVSLLFMSKLPY